VVTGAARGIGAATVRGLAARGWAVLAVDRCGLIRSLGAELGGTGITANAVSAAD
jgi:NAD(P)-dependent dehydrogenase (short-subunit alcohol dehydrogenase family)